MRSNFTDLLPEGTDFQTECQLLINNDAKILKTRCIFEPQIATDGMPAVWASAEQETEPLPGSLECRNSLTECKFFSSFSVFCIGSLVSHIDIRIIGIGLAGGEGQACWERVRVEAEQ